MNDPKMSAPLLPVPEDMQRTIEHCVRHKLWGMLDVGFWKVVSR